MYNKANRLAVTSTRDVTANLVLLNIVYMMNQLLRDVQSGKNAHFQCCISAFLKIKNQKKNKKKIKAPKCHYKKSIKFLMVDFLCTFSGYQHKKIPHHGEWVYCMVCYWVSLLFYIALFLLFLIGIGVYFLFVRIILHKKYEISYNRNNG